MSYMCIVKQFDLCNRFLLWYLGIVITIVQCHSYFIFRFTNPPTQFLRVNEKTKIIIFFTCVVYFSRIFMPDHKGFSIHNKLE